MRAKISRQFFLSAVLGTVFCGGVPQAWAAPAATSTTLVMSSAAGFVQSGGSVPAGSAITLTAGVSSGSAKLTSGRVNFCDASVTYCTDVRLLGTAQLTNAGIAVLKLVPGIGSHSYKAVFAGTPNSVPAYAGSNSVPVTLTVTGTFPTTTAIAAGGSAGNYSLTATVTGQINAPSLPAPAGSVTFLDTTNNVPLGTATLGTGTAVSFLNSSNPLPGLNPLGLAVGDFNGDGIPDLAVTTASASTVTILLGNGDGTFSTAGLIPIAGPDSQQVVVGDFNGDGKADLALLFADINLVQVLLGDGDGTFTALPAIPAPDAAGFLFATADFNGDGKADLVLANNFTDTLTILLGNGDGTFTAAAAAPAINGFPQSVAVGDFNGDGIPDLAVAINTGANGVPSSVEILLGNGDGTFTPTAESPATGDNPASIVTGDFNGDDILDLAVANMYANTFSPGTVTVLLGNGDGTFTPTPVSPVVGFLPNSIAVGDFNGDGIPDLVTANEADNTVTVLLGNGDGTFGTALSPAAGTDPCFLTVGDFNGDGLTDIAASDCYQSIGHPNTVSVLLSQLTRTATATAAGISLAGTGTHQVEASYPGDSLFDSNISATTGLTAQQATPTVKLTLSSSSITNAQALMVTVTVDDGSGNPTPTGSVTLASGSYVSAATPLDGGVAKINVPTGSLAAATDTLTASYSGDSNYLPNTGTASVTVTVPSFQISGAAVTVAPGATTGNASTITVTPAGGFTGSVALTAAITSSPVGAVILPTFSFSSTSQVSITGAAAGTATLTFTTSAGGGCSQAYQMDRRVPWYPAGGAILACVLLFGIPARRRYWRAALGAMALLVFLAGGAVACNGGGERSTCNAILAGTTAGNYIVTVTGTSGGSTATGTVALTVQ